jgi:hypothetical protein
MDRVSGSSVRLTRFPRVAFGERLRHWIVTRCGFLNVQRRCLGAAIALSNRLADTEDIRQFPSDAAPFRDLLRGSRAIGQFLIHRRTLSGYIYAAVNLRCDGCLDLLKQHLVHVGAQVLEELMPRYLLS